jgi:cyclophilin family peptidyl-prolyl cis-trans isomerase
MAKHKAATEVTIAPLAEKTRLEALLSRYWPHATALAVVIVGWILYASYSASRDQEERDDSWEVLGQGTTPSGFGVPTASAGVLADLADELRGTAAGPWARLLQGTTLIDEEKLAEATAAVEQLRADYPTHALVIDEHDFGDDRPPRTLLDNLLDSIDRQQRWEAAHPELFSNPPPAEDAPRIRLETDKGDIIVALYSGQAPLHAQNFLTLSREGYYTETRFHRILPGFMIQGGDPNSRDQDPTTWGQGGPEKKIPPEPNELYHFAGVLSAAKQPGEVESSGSQFFITTDPAHHLDGEHVVFGTVLEGMDVVRVIASGEIAEGTSDRPAEPVVLRATEVLEP